MQPQRKIHIHCLFTNDVFNTIVRHDAFFLGWIFWIPHISITLEDEYKTTFVTNWKTFI